MYATIVRCDLHTRMCAGARRQHGRALAKALAALPGFVAFVALDVDADAGMVAALCIFEEQASMAAADGVIAEWQQEHGGAAGSGMEHLGAGAVIAQKGL